MEQTFKTRLSEAEMEAEIERMLAESRVMLDEIKASNDASEAKWREIDAATARTQAVLDEVTQILQKRQGVSQ